MAHDDANAPTIANLIENATHPADEELAAARAIVEKAIEGAADDPTAHLNPEVMAAFKTVREHDPMRYEAMRTRMKQANKLVRMEALDSWRSAAQSWIARPPD